MQIKKSELIEVLKKYHKGEIYIHEVLTAVDTYSSAFIAEKPIVSQSVEYEKPQPILSFDEIKTTAEMLWKKPMKLEAVKLVMKLGYSLKDAKAYCDLHFG